MKFSMLVPLDRLRRNLAMQNIPLAMGTLVGFIERAADLLAAVDGYHWRQLFAGDWMATDCYRPSYLMGKRSGFAMGIIDHAV